MHLREAEPESIAVTAGSRGGSRLLLTHIPFPEATAKKTFTQLTILRQSSPSSM